MYDTVPMTVAVRLASRIANRPSRVASEPATPPAVVASRRRSVCASLAVVVLAGVIGGSRARAEDGAAPTPAPDAIGGRRVGDTGLWLGGYASLEAEVPRSGPATLQIGDLGLLARWELTPTLALFNETDLEDTVTLVEAQGLERGSRVLLLERLYLEWAATPEFSVRFGKFLTPFGIWNVVRRAPLTWTVDRPVATQNAFPDHTTGASLVWQTTRHGWTVDATAYGQAQDELVRGASDISATAVGGARAVAAHTIGPAYLAIGTSAIGFRDVDTHEWETSYGADVDLTFRRNQLTGEFAYTHLREARASREWGLYLQDVVPLWREVYGVFRYEHVVTPEGRSSNGELVGLAWRPTAHLVLKADYQFVDHPGAPSERSALERGFVASVTVFF